MVKYRPDISPIFNYYQHATIHHQYLNFKTLGQISKLHLKITSIFYVSLEFCFWSKDHINRRIYSFRLEVSVIRTTVQAGNLKLVTQTERIPASAAARHAIGTTSEICFIKKLAWLKAIHNDGKIKKIFV